jgi:hypothetical protein
MRQSGARHSPDWFTRLFSPKTFSFQTVDQKTPPRAEQHDNSEILRA